MANSEYLEMIELPVSTCEMVTPQKKKRFFKGKLIRNVNKKVKEQPKNALVEEQLETVEKTEKVENATTAEPVVTKQRKERRKPSFKFKLDLVGAEVIAIFVLVVTILLTNIFWEDSGINTMIRNVFHTTQEAQVDDRLNTSFTCVAPARNGEITVENGIMNIGEQKVVYPPYQGKVSNIVEKDGLYTVTIAHSDVFYSVISGVEFVYCQVGEKVYDNIPVAYSSKNGTQVAMYNSGTIITDYTIDNGNIVWQS